MCVPWPKRCCNPRSCPARAIMHLFFFIYFSCSLRIQSCKKRWNFKNRIDALWPGSLHFYFFFFFFFSCLPKSKNCLGCAFLFLFLYMYWQVFAHIKYIWVKLSQMYILQIWCIVPTQQLDVLCLKIGLRTFSLSLCRDQPCSFGWLCKFHSMLRFHSMWDSVDCL